MSTDGGGYTFLKAMVGSAYSGAQAEAHCQQYGMHLFIPRTKRHLASAFAVASSVTFGPDASTNYLYIMGIHPKVSGGSVGAGSTCLNRPLHSRSAGCNWVARDGGNYWVTNRTDISEPNGDCGTTSSMYYGFNSDGSISWYNDIPTPGYTSARFMCDTADKGFVGRSCADWRDAGFLVDGNYPIDPDGELGPTAPTTVYCNQTADGGGWRLVSTENFESGSTSGWSSTNAITSCGRYGSMVGGYNVIAGGSNQKSYSLGGVAHTQVRVELDYVKVDSWDGETATVKLDGTSIWTTRFCFCSQGCSGYCGSDGLSCGSGSWVEERGVHVTGVVNNTAASVIVRGESTVDQASNDESWGLDNIQVFVR